MARAGSPWEASEYYYCSKRLHHSHIIQIIVDLLLNHTSIIPAPSVLAVHHSQARESLGGLFFLTRGILFQDVAVGWLDNYIATASSITLRLAPAAILENVAPTSGPRLLARTCTQWLIRSPSQSTSLCTTLKVSRISWTTPFREPKTGQ